MALSFLTNLDEEEFKKFLKEALREIVSENLSLLTQPAVEIMDIKQASELLHLKITTLYEKTSEKTIPHFKKGNKLYFNRSELEAWIRQGKVKTAEQTQSEAITYLLNKK
ncbi:MAG: helix-turn-helix domain-containing protein [Bacteroidia bacterium]|nr:helix-turn-helix domain-containing protein [Bacteroidia bacterium]